MPVQPSRIALPILTLLPLFLFLLFILNIFHSSLRTSVSFITSYFFQIAPERGSSNLTSFKPETWRHITK